MKITFVSSAPQGEFAEVSVLASGWRSKFQTLVSERRAFKFDFYPMPDLPIEVQESVSGRGYRDVVMKKDQWQHFFIPDAIQNS